MKIPKMVVPLEREVSALITLITTRKAFRSLEPCELCGELGSVHPVGAARTSLGELLAVMFYIEHTCAVNLQTERTNWLFTMPAYIIEL